MLQTVRDSEMNLMKAVESLLHPWGRGLETADIWQYRSSDPSDPIPFCF